VPVFIFVLPHLSAQPAPILPPDRVQSGPVGLLSLGLLQRLLILAFIFASELVVISVWLDDATLIPRGGLISLVGVWGAWVLRGIVGFAAFFVTFAYLKNRVAIEGISHQVVRIPLRWSLFAAHFSSLAIFGGLSAVLYSPSLSGYWPDLIAVAWLVFGIAAIALAALAFVPLAVWVRVVRSTGYLWAYALIAVILACLAGSASRFLWQPLTHLTFGLVKTILTPFTSSLIANPATMSIGTNRFSVQIAPQCSGLEGAGLMLAFGVAWLCLFRHECRFPQALLLIPAGVALLFLLNSARIAALILIGNAGAERIALGGFHSQAGWIAFNVVALGFSVAARRLPWLATTAPGREKLHTSSDNPTAAYLVPFLTILGVGMISRAATGDFEWLYPLRFFAAAVVLWMFRRRYGDLDWKFGWYGPAIGALVFVTWIALDRVVNIAANDAVPSALAASSAQVRVIWIAFRVLAAVVTVPVAEELAFRGYLLRRVISPDFESVSPKNFTWLGLLISSVAFGLLHGNFWFAGILAGVLYGLAVVRRGRIGDAVVAHATTNALLAAYVLTFHQWHLW
jgi:exosortase E/protease (VPEID-CTERM system)